MYARPVWPASAMPLRGRPLHCGIIYGCGIIYCGAMSLLQGQPCLGAVEELGFAISRRPTAPMPFVGWKRESHKCDRIAGMLKLNSAFGVRPLQNAIPPGRSTEAEVDPCYFWVGVPRLAFPSGRRRT